MNVMINDISEDLDTSVEGVQATITAMLLIMAVLMIPGGKLTDRWGRKRCFVVGSRALRRRRSAERGLPGPRCAAPRQLGAGGRGHVPPDPARLHPHDDGLRRSPARARAFGVISGLGGVGAAAGPLIGGLITTWISWRAAFLFQVVVIAVILLLARRVVDPVAPDPDRPFDLIGAILSAVGMFFVVFGILLADNDLALTAVFIAVGAGFLVAFFLHTRARERVGRDPLISLRLFRNRTSNLGLVTQNIQWLLLMGVSFVVAVFLQTVRGYNAIETGLVFTAATVGILASSLAAERLAKRYSQRTLILAGFAVTAAGIGLLLGFVGASSRVVAFVPGLLLIGVGLGVMLTPSVNIVQSSFPEEQQGEISGVSRAVSNLGSSFGAAIAGTILVSNLASGNGTYVVSMVVLAALAIAGFAAALLLPTSPTAPESRTLPHPGGVAV